MYSKYGVKLKRWLTRGRITALVIALAGGGLFVGGATGTLASRETGAGQAEAAETVKKTAPLPAQDENAAAPRAAVAESKKPTPDATPKPTMRIALAPRPDRERPARRLAELVTPQPKQDRAPAGHAGVATDSNTAWQRFAAKAPVIDGPMIAIVIDDLGPRCRRHQTACGVSRRRSDAGFLALREPTRSTNTDRARRGPRNSPSPPDGTAQPGGGYRSQRSRHRLAARRTRHAPKVEPLALRRVCRDQQPYG